LRNSDFGLNAEYRPALTANDEAIESAAEGFYGRSRRSRYASAKSADATQRPNEASSVEGRRPLGVVFFIYESRTKRDRRCRGAVRQSGNAVIIRGGKEGDSLEHQPMNRLWSEE